MPDTNDDVRESAMTEIVALADEIGRKCPSAAPEVTRIVVLAGALRQVPPLDRSEIVDTIDEASGSELSSAQSARIADAILSLLQG